MKAAGEAGMAHLLEHMVFKGSTKHTNIPKELTEHGARPNGSTTTTAPTTSKPSRRQMKISAGLSTSNRIAW